MFTLFQTFPKFPEVQRINVRMAKNYISKFEESLKNFEEFQKEIVNS